MALSIRLSHDESKPLTPGSMVLGVVKFVSHEDRFIEALRVDFRGRTSTFLNQNFGDLALSRTDYASEAYLFSQNLDVFTGVFLHRKGTYAWPFAFRIPLFAAPRMLPRGSKELFSEMPPWKGDASRQPHPLPPSMTQEGKFACSVQYVLEATTLQRTTPTEGRVPKSKEIHAYQQIAVQNLDMSFITSRGFDRPYTISRHVLKCPHPTSTGRSKVVSRLLAAIAKKDSTPRIDPELRLSILLPKKFELTEGSKLSILMSAAIYEPPATISPDPSTAESPSHLEISSFKIRLDQNIAVRAGCHSSASTNHLFTRTRSCLIPLLRFTSPTALTSQHSPTAYINLSDSTDLSIPTDLLAADFSTYNIVSSHRLQISLTVTYKGKKHKVCLREVPLRVLPCSGEELERILSEGLEIDDEYGCELAGIKWRSYRRMESDFAGEGWAISELVVGDLGEGFGEDEDSGNATVEQLMPPAYSA